MNTKHVIAQCAWQSSFDQQAKAHDLQNFISRWSNTVLTEELDRCFSALCPATQTWRINSLNLDLGDISLNDLPQELPRRLRASLHTAIEHMLAHQQLSIASNDSDNMQVLDHIESLHAFVHWFLQNGTTPWWFSGTENALQILDRQLDQNASSTIEIIRDLGRSEIVRQRLVWQLGEARVRRIIHLLEPWRGDYICSFADNLFVTQQEQQLPTSDASEFRECTWLTILKHLLVDRGSLFNTTAFVRANLWQASQHYQIDYQKLLDLMFQAVQKLKPDGLIHHDFFNAIEAIHLQDLGSAVSPAIEKEPSPDPWQALQKMLHHGLKHDTLGTDTVQAGELFTALAQQDASRMAKLLLLEGASQHTRQGLLKNFGFAELTLLVQVLEPREYTFIVAHVQHTRTQVEQQSWDKKSVWQVLLAYLLTKRDSQFNRRQLIHETLLKLCKQRSFDLPIFLDLLIHSAQVQHPGQHNFELLSIFKHLRAELEKLQPASEARHAYQQAILRYLKTGKYDVHSGTQELPRQVIFDCLNSAPAAQSLTMLLCATELQCTDDVALSRRLLKLVGAEDFSLLLNLLEPDATRFCVSLIDSLLYWQKRAALPALDGVDLALQIPTMLIQALPGFYQRQQGSRSRFELTTFWHAFVALLKQQGGVNIAAFQQQLQDCLAQDRPLTSADIKQVLPPLIPANAARPGSAQTLSPSRPAAIDISSAVMLRQWTPNQLFSALRLRCFSRSEDLPQALKRLPIALLWQQLEQLGSDAISNWLDNQPDKYLLLKILSQQRHILPIGRWLLVQLPAELNPPEEHLKHLTALLQQTGYWQGASAVLQQQLDEVFWSVCFDARAQNLSTAEILARMLSYACLRLDIRLSNCLDSFNTQKDFLLKTHWHNACQLLINHTAQSTESTPAIEVDFHQDYLACYLDHPRFLSIARCLLQQGRPPAWLKAKRTLDLSRLLFDVFTVRPRLLPALLADLQQQHAVMFRLLNIVPFDWLIDAMRTLSPNKQASILLLSEFQQCLEKITLPDSNGQQRSAILFRLILNYWLKHDWVTLAPDQLISLFLYQLMRQQQLSISSLEKAFKPHMATLPASLRHALVKVLNDTDTTKSPTQDRLAPAVRADKKLAEAIKLVQSPRPSTTPMCINNAGLVILQSFISTLFSRLKLTENDQFVSPVAQRRAVHYLQFLVSGNRETAEQDLILNKLLCGMTLHEPVEIGIEISTDEEQICHSLLNSVIEYWEAIGSSSIDGCRGDWLVRNGSLTDATDHWDLIVDRRAYDLLLAQAPFSYSVINLPWMEKAIYVTWPT